MLWELLSLLRVGLVFAPQTGYIHPDEFFQSTEIAAGDIFDLQVNRTWEFAGERPVRSAAVVYVMTGLPLWLLKGALRYLAGNTVPSSYLLLVVPRFFFCLISFSGDFAIHRICKYLGMTKRDRNRCLSLFASSHVAITLYTRTFSNSVESCLLSLLLAAVAADARHRAGSRKEPSAIGYGDVVIPVLVVFGIFNRPTFVLYAFPAVTYWLLDGGQISKSGFTVALRRAIAFLPNCFLFTFLMALADTVYYHQEILSLRVEQWFNTSLVWTPINFIRYNLDRANLETHGSHPYWLHILVNIPLLFNIGGILALWSSLQATRSVLFHCVTSSKRLSFSTSFNFVLVSTVILSLLGLSAFSHQEPRFLAPLLVPVVLLSERYFRSRQYLTVVWVLGNLACMLFYGFLHQGGLVPCLLKLGNWAEHDMHRQVTFLFKHTYMPPRHLLTLRNELNGGEVIDLMGSSSAVAALQSVREGSTTVFVLPAGSEQELVEAGVILETLFRCGPHLSTELPPKVNDLIDVYRRDGITQMLALLAERTALVAYRVKVGSGPELHLRAPS